MHVCVSPHVFHLLLAVPLPPIPKGMHAALDRPLAQDVRRLTSENAALIAEMNLLRNERKSWQRSYKEMEARMMVTRAKCIAQSCIGDMQTHSLPLPGEVAAQSSASSC